MGSLRHATPALYSTIAHPGQVVVRQVCTVPGVISQKHLKMSGYERGVAAVKEVRNDTTEPDGCSGMESIASLVGKGLLDFWEQSVSAAQALRWSFHEGGGELGMFAVPCESEADFRNASSKLLAGFPERTATWRKGEGKMAVWADTDQNDVLWIPGGLPSAVPIAGPSEQPVAVVIKGHVRGALGDQKLRKMLLNLQKKLAPRPMHLFVETWDWTEAQNSWRALDAPRVQTKVEDLEAYFEGLTVKRLNINSEATAVQLIGRTDGKVGGSKAPKFNWKHWIWLLWKSTKSVTQSGVKYQSIIHTRWDWMEERVLINMKHPDQSMWDPEDALLAITKCVGALRPSSLAFLSVAGCDNLFVGDPATCSALADKLHAHLDEVVAVSPDLWHQEQYVLLAADELARQQSTVRATIQSAKGGDIEISADPADRKVRWAAWTA